MRVSRCLRSRAEIMLVGNLFELDGLVARKISDLPGQGREGWHRVQALPQLRSRFSRKGAETHMLDGRDQGPSCCAIRHKLACLGRSLSFLVTLALQ